MLVVVVRAKHETHTFEYDQPVITIGRADVNDIVLPTAKVSKRHARLEISPQGLVLTDLKSTNGSYVNGRRVVAPALIGEGDRVHIGEFIIELKSATGLPSTAGQRGFSPLFQASADTEPQEQGAATATTEETGTRRGSAYRMSWLDDWAAPTDPPQRAPGRSPVLTGRSPLEGHRRESSMAFTFVVSMPGLVSVGQHVGLRMWADARSSARETTAGRQRLSTALEVNISLPDGKIEAYQTDQGMVQVQLGGQSGELLLPLRGRDTGPARIEVAVCHRGARLTTLTLRPEVRAMSIAEMGELSPHSEILVNTPLESVLLECGPQAVLRVREYGPLGEGASEPQPSISGSHSTEGARRRRLKVELLLLHEETSEILASGEVILEVPLADRVRTFLSSQEVERIGGLADNQREQALQSIGESLAQMLLPPLVREALGALQPGSWLAVDSAETWVPWEMVRVSRGLTSYFLAERFALSRSGSGSYTSRFATAPWTLVSPAGAETLVRREQQSLALLDVRLRNLHRVSDIQPLIQQAGIAAWHISGHGGFDRADKSGAGLRLEDGVLSPVQIVPAARFRKSGQTPPFQGSFVFLAVSEPTAPPSPLAPAGTAQWVERFLAAGAGAVVATNWPVSSAKAGQFAETLYRAWSGNRPLAVAASEAREAIRSEGDPAWLAFAVYGLPGARLGGL
jgi:hypothetical protein